MTNNTDSVARLASLTPRLLEQIRQRLRSGQNHAKRISRERIFHGNNLPANVGKWAVKDFLLARAKRTVRRAASPLTALRP